MNPANWAEQMYDAMLNADRAGAAALVERAIGEGISAERILNEILDPALIAVGRMWGDQLLSLAQGYVGAKIAEDVLLRCLPDPQTAAAPHKGTVVIGNIEDDYHSLGRRMVASFLRCSGWEVHDLGNDVPAEQFVAKAVEVGACVVGASAMMQTTALGIRKLRDLIDARGLGGRLKLAVGGAVFNWRPELVAAVGGDGTAGNAAAVDALCQRLQAEAKAEAAP